MSNIDKQAVQAVADLKAGYTLGHADVEIIQQMALDAATLLDELEALQSFRTAFNEWHDKTEWVQGDKRFDVIKPWGKHRADVLKLYIDHLESSLKSRLLTNADRDIAALRQRIADQQGIILSTRQFISEYAASGDAGADEFVKVIDRAAGIGKGNKYVE
ncbi:TPA: hypothetical protein ACG0MZ_000740 [Citrobacter farmeri]